jgi:hypothetical protein
MIFDFGFSILECRSLSEGESDKPIQNEKTRNYERPKANS